MKIKISLCLSIFCFFSLIHTMDEAPKDQKNKNELISTDSGAVVIPIEYKEEKRKSVVPPIDLAVMQQQQANGSSSEGQRTPISSIGDLRSAVSKKALTSRKIVDGATTRRLITRSRATPSEGDDVVQPQTIDMVGSAPQKTPSLLPERLPERRVSARQLFNIHDEKMYTEADLWEKLEHANPALCAFAKAHNMDLDEFDEYAVLMQELQVDPEIITQYMREKHPERDMHWFNQGLAYMFRASKESQIDRVDKQYEKIRKENPENYKVMVLELMMKCADEEIAGEQKRSLIADTHTAIQNDEINAQATQIRQQWLGLIVAGATLIGGWVTSGVQYFGPASPAGNCTGT